MKTFSAYFIFAGVIEVYGTAQCPPSISTQDTLPDPITGSITVLNTAVTSNDYFLLSAATVFLDCQNFCDFEGDGCLAFTYTGANDCRIYPHPISDDMIIESSEATTVFYCDRRVPTSPPASASIVNFDPNERVLSCPDNGFFTTENVAIAWGGTDLLPFPFAGLCPQACAEFRTCSGYTIFEGACILYRGRIEQKHLISVQGSTLGTKCYNFDECDSNMELVIQDAAVISGIPSQGNTRVTRPVFCEGVATFVAASEYNFNTEECTLYAVPIYEHLTYHLSGSTVRTSCACPTNQRRVIQSAAVTPNYLPEVRIRGAQLSYDACLNLCGTPFSGCLAASYDFSSQECNLYGRLISEDLLITETESRVVFFCGRQSTGGIMVNQ